MRLSVRHTKLWGICAGVAIGVATGGGLYTFVYARGVSYLSEDPRACINCHIMRDHYDAWLNSSHRAVATCNDCHTPPGLFPKSANKAKNGFFHSLHFTTGKFPDPLRITPSNRDVTESACRKCHAEITHVIEPRRGGERLPCLQCHAEVGHPLR